MKWQTYPIDRYSEHANEWNTLVRESGAIPFHESDFIEPLLKEFGTGHELLAICRDHQGAAQAAAILNCRGKGIWETFQPSQFPLGAWIARPGTDFPSLLKELIKALPGVAIGIGVTQIDPLLQARPAETASLQTLDYIQTAWVEITGSFDEYWEARGKNLKQNLRKARTKLQNDGVTIHLECLTDAASVAAAIREYGVLESAGWKAEGGTAIHPDNAQGRFYRAMLENFCRQGRARIYRYHLNDHVVAMDLCIENDSTIVILKTAYDEAYKAASPAFLMRQDQFREFFAEGRLKRIEFYGKVMEWHTRWTDSQRTLYHVTAYRWSLLQTLHTKLKQLRQAPAETRTTAET